MGIMEEIKNFSSLDASVLNDPVVESEIVLNALRNSCASEEGFASLLESAGTEMALYGLISDENIATEVVKLFQDSLARRERVGMVFVTEHGEPDEELLGIITAWDMAAFF